MLPGARVTCVFLVALAASGCISGALAEQLRAPSDPEQEATVEISVKNRNGVPLLTEVLKVLANISADPRFSRALTRLSALSPEEANCLANVRKDASGRVFDSAYCLGVWPDATKATLPKEFEKTFELIAGNDASHVFPYVQVTPFEFQLRMQATQFLPELPGGNLEWVNDQLKPTASFQNVLCNPKITFIEPTKCEVNVVTRFNVYPDDLYISQTGYRVRLTNVLTPELARTLSAEFLRRLNLPKGTSRDAVTLSILRPEAAQPEQQAAIAESPPPSPEAGIEKLWRFLGTEVDKLDLAHTADAQPPTFLLFDSQYIKEPVLITDWLRQITSAQTRSPASDCNVSASDSMHTDAVASLLFPEALAASLRRKNSNAPMPLLPSQEWTGFLLGSTHFRGSDKISDLRWFEKSLLARPEDPLIALIVYSRGLPYDSKGDDYKAATNAAATFLNEPSTLLVISAPQKSKVPGALAFSGPNEPRTDAESLEAACLGRAWPACLGRHPRVLVVASSKYPEDERRPALADKDSYLLGSSTVRMAAPGINVPILERCEPDGGWRIGHDSGTSYSAPQVALLLSKLIQISPEGVRNNLPEAAVWRVLATSQPFAIEDATVEPLTEFGRMDAGLALRGASISESGADAAATLYEEDGEGRTVVTQAVVMPYMWNDQPSNISRARKYENFRKATRNYITYSQPDEDRVETLAFKRLLRVVRRPNDFINDTPTFDIYFVSEVPRGQARSVVVRKRVLLGSGRYIESGGYCRYDGLTAPDVPGANRLSQAQPACLYAWRKGTEQFVPLDLAKVTDIVFPILHISGEFPAKISPADLDDVVAASSPWREVFCSTGPRLAVKEMLEDLQQPTWESGCQQ